EVVEIEGRKMLAVQKHFRACDPTSHPVRSREAGLWTGLAGGGIGALFGGKKGAVIGGVSGVVVGLKLAKEHGDCNPVETTLRDLKTGQVFPVSSIKSTS